MNQNSEDQGGIALRLFAHAGADSAVFRAGRERVEALTGRGWGELFREAGPEELPRVLFFLSGGSEGPAAQMLRQEPVRPPQTGRFFLLLAFPQDNSHAAALEVLAFLRCRGDDGLLINLDAPGASDRLDRALQALKTLDSLRGGAVGLLGEPSDWLIASTVDPGVLEERLGLELRQVSWASRPGLEELEAPREFLDRFTGWDGGELEKAGRVYGLLDRWIREEGLQGAAVECFSLVVQTRVSGCLALALLNTRGIPASCEGDLVSLAGMLLGRGMTGIVPWIVNIASLEGRRAFLAHCTVPLNLIEDPEIDTHFETGVGTALRGQWKGEEGAQLLAENPLGNHHLVFPGNRREELALVCRAAGMEVL